VQGFSLEGSVSAICGGAFALAGILAVLSLVSLLSARSSDAAVERAASFAISLVAVVLGLAAFWSANGGPAAMGGSVAYTAMQATRFLELVGVPVALFQIQAAVASVVVAFLAWRFPHRQ
jgi:hypothetical protein